MHKSKGTQISRKTLSIILIFCSNQQIIEKCIYSFQKKLSMVISIEYYVLLFVWKRKIRENDMKKVNISK